MRIAGTWQWGVAAAALALAVEARAQGACWAPDRSQPPDRAVARVAPLAALSADIARVSELFKQNPAFLQIPGMRLMVTSHVGYAYAGFGHDVRISAGLYPPNTWRDGCTLTSGPEFFNAGHVHVRFNSPDEIFRYVPPALRDEALTAYEEPTGAMPIGDETYYAGIRGVVLTPGRVPAWVPVTVAEWLAYRERAALRTVDEASRQLADLDSSVERYRADMAQQIAQTPDAAQQAQLRRAMEEHSATLRAGVAEGRGPLAHARVDAESRLQAVRDERARLSPAQLAGQARKDRTPLVKVNPTLAGGSRRVNLIVVHAVENQKSMAEPLDQAVREMDYVALRALLR